MILLKVSTALQGRVQSIVPTSFNLQFATSSEDLFSLLRDTPPALVILEIDNPKCENAMLLEAICHSSLVIVITQILSEEYINKLLSYQIHNLITLPCPDRLLLLKIENALSYNCMADEDSTLEMQQVQSALIDSLATLAEYRHQETGEHINRTQNYVKAMAKTLQMENQYSDILTDINIELIFHSVPLHDIGKVGIPDHILLKPDRLTDDEFEIMKDHAKIGHFAIQKIQNKMSNNAFLQFAADVTYTHHEKWDGTGYPRGLKGDEIPLIGRIMAIADVYDALVSKRVYKPSMTHEEAYSIIVSGSGTQFDPQMVKCFQSIHHQFRNIHNIFSDYQIREEATPHREDISVFLKNGLIKKILLVDDSILARTMHKNLLATSGFIVDDMPSALEGLAKIRKNDYDLILSDIDMPKMNGYEFASLAKPFLRKGVPFIAITAQDYEMPQEKLSPFGIDAYLLKPLDLKVLAVALSKFYKS